MTADHPLLSAFRRAAQRVPAYGQVLAEGGVDPADVRSLDDFLALVPVLDKESTFGRFRVADLCCDGDLARPNAVLTSSGHSGLFAFGLYHADTGEQEARRIDDALDGVFGIRSKPTLMINCLPMGVKVYSRECTLGETSVRADMVAALVQQFGAHHEQIILVGETAFIKHVLEFGQSQGICWQDLLVHVIVGEEPIAENARAYLLGLLGVDANGAGGGWIVSSMGVAELGLNLFFELPALAAMRRAMHRDRSAARALARGGGTMPMIFTYDPGRLFLETDEDGGLLVSTLDLDRRLPLIRYRTGDSATLVPDPGELIDMAGMAGRGPEPPEKLPLVLIHGRGRWAQAGNSRVYPEAVKEVLYHDPALARLITANFRIRSGPQRALLRIQLSPGVDAKPELPGQFARAARHHITAGLEIVCQEYAAFGNGMALDYERKFDYLEEDTPPNGARGK